MSAKLLGNMLIAHGGGPTPVINSSLKGAVKEAQKHGEIKTIYGARFGAEGILKGDLVDLGGFDEKVIDRLAYTPASALGSCRRKLANGDYPKVLECFRKFNIRYFFYNGGNDSMDTCNKIYRLACQKGYELHVIGIPKTIDNDLAVTDHCPGYGSAARYAAISALELSFDAASLPIHVIVMEIMGRNAGWLTAAGTLYAEDMPCEYLTCLPEISFDKNKFLEDVKDKYSKGHGLLVLASEGIHYADGAPVADSGVVDGFGHKVPGGAAHSLADMIMTNTGFKARSEKPGLLGRVSVALASEIDRREAFEAGAFAVRSAVEGKSGYMVGFSVNRKNGYQMELTLIELSKVANAEKKFPSAWINPEGNGITAEFKEYCRSLTGEKPPPFARLCV